MFKNRVSVAQVGVSIGFSASLLVLMAAGYPSKPYEATFENYAGGTPMRSHVWNDGQGHQRSESTIAGVNRVSILDFPNKTIYSINDEQKTINVMSMTPAGNYASDETIKWTPIGAKVIDGHPCQGRRGVSSGQQIELWDGSDVGGCTVAVVTNGATTQKLLSWKPYSPNPSQFALPAGYKKVDMAALMRGFSGGGMQGMPQGGKFDPAALQKMYQRPQEN